MLSVGRDPEFVSKRGGGGREIYIPKDKVQRRENFINWCILDKVYPQYTASPG